MGLSLDKVQQQAPALLSLAKEAQNSVQKYNLNGQKAKVALVLDFSGSMGNEYRNGSMQRLTEKVLALATQLDDDGAIDFFVFDSGAAHLGEVRLADYAGSVERLTRGRHMGTTNYAAAFTEVERHFGFRAVAPQGQKRGLFGMKKAEPAQAAPAGGPADEPVFAIFLTDGAPNSKGEAVRELTRISTVPIFWKFLSIGRENIEFLQKLDDLDDRFIDNADYKPVGNVDNLSESALYDMLLDEYPSYLSEARAKGLIR